MSKKKQQRQAGANFAGPVEGAVTGLLRAAFQRTAASSELRERLISTTLNILSEPRSARSRAHFQESGAAARPNSLPEIRSDAFTDRPEPSHRRNTLADGVSADETPAHAGGTAERNEEIDEERAAVRLRSRTRSMGGGA